MKKQIYLLLFFVLAMCLSSSIKAQTVPIQSAGFSYVLTDPGFVSGDHYDVNIFLYDPSSGYIASQTQLIGTFYVPGAYSYVGNTIMFYMFQSNGYQVGLFVSKNDFPLGSQRNRVGLSGVLIPDANGVVHPSTINVASW
ncbi:MAG: hypothetical protein M0P47_11845 [Bacteroidales bacterium]|nr:hypothetical protein [Bacteroidales bacterium]